MSINIIVAIAGICTQQDATQRNKIGRREDDIKIDLVGHLHST
jgi:short-subunit dehydrogenase involved in D-alanine esterification of teichoic acids